MAKIAISELRPAGAELFDGSESFLQELTDNELNATKGGLTPFLAGVAVGILISARYCNAR
ncbi:class IIb bacteriocin, lactobin A/cerein 7B family [Calothrix sp. CCY 0018]|uniref:class IIb bacteriocin, lactobin A/cerein 7B family n=1 Tax=Calothrix sp. CCY 0018 TaxID=3103864 RepID=UPI0039C64345